MPLLPSPTGPYDVGATTFILPVRPPIPTGTARIRDSNGQLIPALQVEQVTFTAYYPAICSCRSAHKKRKHWVKRPLKDAINGYTHFTKLSPALFWSAVLLFGAWLKIPVHENAPPLRIQSTPYPLVLFSHGLGSDSTTYSQICSHLASHGQVVLAFEHHDGSGPIARPRSESVGRDEPMFFLRSSEVIWEDGRPVDIDEPSRFKLRIEQLKLRDLEIYLGYEAFSRLISRGELGSLQIPNGAPLDRTWIGGEWVQTKTDIRIIGHSFGGGTVISLLSNPPPAGYGLTQIPISHAVALDPWFDPLSPNPVPYSGTHSVRADGPKLLVLTAEEMTLWKDHFEHLMSVIRGWKASVAITIVGSTHVSFSDFPVMLPRPVRSAAARPLLDTINSLILGFLNDKLAETIEKMPIRRMEVKKEQQKWYKRRVKGERSRLVGNPGDLLLHIGPIKL